MTRASRTLKVVVSHDLHSAKFSDTTTVTDARGQARAPGWTLAYGCGEQSVGDCFCISSGLLRYRPLGPVCTNKPCPISPKSAILAKGTLTGVSSSLWAGHSDGAT